MQSAIKFDAFEAQALLKSSMLAPRSVSALQSYAMVDIWMPLSASPAPQRPASA